MLTAFIVLQSLDSRSCCPSSPLTGARARRRRRGGRAGEPPVVSRLPAPRRGRAEWSRCWTLSPGKLPSRPRRAARAGASPPPIRPRGARERRAARSTREPSRFLRAGTPRESRGGAPVAGRCGLENLLAAEAARPLGNMVGGRGGGGGGGGPGGSGRRHAAPGFARQVVQSGGTARSARRVNGAADATGGHGVRGHAACSSRTA